MRKITWRFVLGRLPLPMLALAASHGVYSFGRLYMPWYFAFISAAAFELTYVGLAVAELHSDEERKRARNISIGAVAVSILYNAVAAYAHRNPAMLVANRWQVEVTLALLHAAPLATVAYLVASLLLHSDAQPESRNQFLSTPPHVAPRILSIKRPQSMLAQRPERLLVAPRQQRKRRKQSIEDVQKDLTLDDRALEIIRLRDEEQLTFTQIGERYGFTRQAASAIYNGAKRGDSGGNG